VSSATDRAPEGGGRDPWRGGELPELLAARPLPAGSVLKRLGPSGIRAGGDDLVDALREAYEALTAPPA
jgi:hypothetical protein